MAKFWPARQTGEPLFLEAQIGMKWLQTPGGLPGAFRLERSIRDHRLPMAYTPPYSLPLRELLWRFWRIIWWTDFAAFRASYEAKP